MTKPLSIASLLTLAACSGGAISVDVAMPRPGGVTTSPDGSITMASGVVVDGGDGSSVCERIRVSVYAPGGATPVATGAGLGTYDLAAAQPRCQVLIVNLSPRGDYSIKLEYPGRSPTGGTYYTEGRPSLFPVTLRHTAGPIQVTDKQTTKLTGSFTVERATPGV